jgi:hypothetical protein
VYVSGRFAEGRTVSLGRAGAVVEAEYERDAQMQLFDEYFGVRSSTSSGSGFVSLLAGDLRACA